MSIRGYKVVEMTYSHGLETEVKLLMLEGWEPIGGVQMAVTVEVNHTNYGAMERVETWAQAMVLPEVSK